MYRMKCPCGKPLDYDSCCGMYHSGKKAPDAESLMRSRYSAYCLRLESYLLETWHPSTRPGGIEFEGLKWIGLEVKACTQDTVEFVARYKVNGKAYRLHENSRFVFDDGAWLYLEGI